MKKLFYISFLAMIIALTAKAQTDHSHDTIGSYIGAGPNAYTYKGITTRFYAHGGISYSWHPHNGLSNPHIAAPYVTVDRTTAYTVAITLANGVVVHANVKVFVTGPYSSSSASCNDIVANGNFETHTGVCNGTLNYFPSPQPAGFPFTMPNSWVEPNTASTDYFNGCSPFQINPPSANVPNTWFGFQNAHSGSGFAGFIPYYGTSVSGFDYSEYLQQGLGCTLLTGQRYNVTFYLALAPRPAFACSDIGAYLSNGPITGSGYGYLTAVPQITTGSTMVGTGTGITTVGTTTITNTTPGNWAKVSGTMTGTNENYITVGCFTGSPTTSLVNSGGLQYPYYFLDDVSITPLPPVITTTNVTACSGSTFTLCATGGANYTWTGPGGFSNSGSCVTVTAPNVNTTTVYTYTVTTNISCPTSCSYSSTVTVTVTPGPPIAVNSPTICAGATATLTASGATSYTWSTNAGSATTSTVAVSPTNTTVYTVTGTGTNGCTSSATATVIVTVNPPLFSGNPCSNQTNTVTITNVQPNTTYSWSPSVTCLPPLPPCSQVSMNPANGTIYTVVATNTITMCTSTETLSTNTSPNPVVSPSQTLCATGAQTTATISVATGFTNVSWAAPGTGTLSCSTCLAPTVTVSATSTFTVTVTGNNGCSTIKTVTINIIPAPIISITTNPSPPVLCTTPVILNANSNGLTYTWTPSSGLSCTNCPNPVANPTVTTMYVVTTTGTNGCTAQSAVTVTVQCQCTNGSIHTNTVMPNAPQFIGVVHSMNPSQGNNVMCTTNLTLNNKVLYFSPNVRLVVNPNVTLTLNHCHLLACSDMWQGIVVQPGGKLVIKDSSLIEDAYDATNCGTWLQPATSNSLTIDGCVFNRCDTAVFLNNFSYTNTNFPATIRNTVITCRTLPWSLGGNFGWTTSATPQNLKKIVSVPDLQAPYVLANTPSYSITTLKAPMQYFNSHYGVFLNSIGSCSNNGMAPSATQTYTDVTIGDPANNNYLNLFDGLYYGIYALSSNFTSVNNSFELMQILPGKLGSLVSGRAIYASNTQISNAIYTRARVIYPGYAPGTNPNINNIPGSTPSFNNKFFDNARAAEIINYQETDLAGADIRSTQSTATPNSLTGGYGFMVQSPVYLYNYMRYNAITNISNTITFMATVISGQQFLGSVNADYNFISANFGNPPTTQYVSNAIQLDNTINCYNSVNCNFLNTVNVVSANNNTVLDVYRGIEKSNWIAFPQRICCLQMDVTANNNYVSLIQDPNNSNGNTQFGINTNSCFGNRVENNNVNGPATTNILIRGVYVKDNANTLVSCNYANNLGKGFEFEGQTISLFPNNVSAWQNNTMLQNQHGFQLTNNAVIGQQGSAAAASDNQWLGTWTGSNFGTYTDITMTTAPKIFIRSVNPPYHPQNCGWVNQSANYCNILNNLLPIGTASTFTCPSLPQPPCTNNCRNSGTQIAEQAVQDSIAYAILPAENSYKVKLKLFKAMIADSTFYDSSAVLRSFFIANQSSNLNRITGIESNLAQGSVSAAQTMNAAFVPANTIENNYKNFFAAHINYINSSYTTADSATIITLAKSCPAIHGDVVYQARIFYNRIYNQYEYFEDNCDYDSLAQNNSSNQRATPIKTLSVNENKIVVYPNPNSGEMFISGSNISDSEWNIEVKDLTGRILIKQTLVVANGMARLKANLPNGVYFITVKGSYGNAVTQKIIVNN